MITTPLWLINAAADDATHVLVDELEVKGTNVTTARQPPTDGMYVKRFDDHASNMLGPDDSMENGGVVL